jgi:hypothetical protein
LWVSFKPGLKVLECVHMIFLLLLTWQAGHKFGSTLTHVQIAFQNTLNWPKLNSKNVWNFTDSVSSVFEGRFFHLSHILNFFTPSVDVLSILNLQKRSHHCRTSNTTQKVVLFPLSALWKPLSKFFEVSIAFFLQFKAKFDAELHYFKSIIFRYARLQMEHTFVLNKTLWETWGETCSIGHIDKSKSQLLDTMIGFIPS